MARIVKSLERSVLPAALSSNLELNEFTGDRSKSHWWWDTQRPNDGGVMFDRKVRKFISRALRSCHRAGTGNDGAAVGSAAAFESVSLNPATFSGNHGVRVVQFDVPFRYARVRGERQTHKGGWIFRTSNALRFECTPSPRTEGKYLLPRAVDNTTFSPEELEQAVVAAVESTSRSVTFAKHVETGVWRIVSPSEPHHTTTGRGIATSGPMRQVFDRNSAVIVPAGDDDAMSLAVLLANSHFAASRTTLPIVVEPQDAESPSSLMAKYAHLNLIFIGRSALRNVIVNDLSPPAFPFRLRESGFTFHGRVHTNAAAAFIVPWQSDRVLQRYDRLALVLTEEASGTRESPLLDLMASHTYSSNTPLTRSMFTNMVPDWIVTDGDEFLWKGLGGLSAAGYFSHRDWSADRVMSVF
jgi:hypothetical protein